MSIQRVFLGSGRHCLHAVVDHLCERFPDSGGNWDLGDLLLLLPGARAGRRLEALLLDSAGARDLLLIPPSIATLGALPDVLVVPRLLAATTAAEQLAWIQVLQGADHSTLARLIGQGGHPGGEYSAEAFEAFAGRLALLSGELGGAGLNFADVASHESIAASWDSRRWEDLAALQERQASLLETAGFESRDVRLRMAAAGEAEILSSGHGSIGVISADMNAMQRQLLDRLETTGRTVFSLIHADDDDADSFDAYGCVDPAAWIDRPIDLPDGVVRFMDGPEDQVACVVDLIGGLGKSSTPDDLVIGVPDESLLPHCRRILPTWGVPVHDPSGVPMLQASLVRLLAGIERYLEDGLASEFGALLRHPLIERWLAVTSDAADYDVITAFDCYIEASLPLVMPRGLPEGYEKLGAVIRPLIKRLHLLRNREEKPGEWAEVILELLLDFLEPSTAGMSEQDIKVLDQVVDELRDLAEIPADLSAGQSAPSVLRLLLRMLERGVLSQPPGGPAVELLGWLECHLDDAGTLLLAGFNEGVVPESVNADPFLPNEIRSALSIVDNDRRYARDAFLLQAILNSGRRVHVVAGRRGSEGDPLRPSRLLLTGDTESMAQRVLAFAGDGQQQFQHDPDASQDPADGFVPCPPPRSIRPVTMMSVTAFSTYLACPYRYMLSNVLGLKVQDDCYEEMSASAFGILAHDVLEDFGHGECREDAPTTDVNVIIEQLDSYLDARADARFGPSRLPSVALQLQLLRRRLHAFAAAQAAWARKGWHIRHVELSFGADTARRKHDHPPVPFPGRESILLVGRIDRIDINMETGRICALDYKTSNTATSPEKAHRSKSAWVNLQLPLYRHLVESTGIDLDSCDVGYVNLPADLEETRIDPATWTQDDYEEADAAAKAVIDGILAGRFEVSADYSLPWDDWERICGVEALRLTSTYDEVST